MMRNPEVGLMVNGMVPSGYSDHYVDGPDGLPAGKRFWWCPTCYATFDRHHAERGYKFCFNCEQRDALLVEMKPIGPGADSVHDAEGGSR